MGVQFQARFFLVRSMWALWVHYHYCARDIVWHGWGYGQDYPRVDDVEIRQAVRVIEYFL